MIFEGVPWPFIIPIAVFAVIWGIMNSRVKHRKLVHKKKRRSTKRNHYGNYS